MFAALVVVAVHNTQPGAAAPRAQAPGQGGRGVGTSFPAQQRPTDDPAIVERGRQIYTVSCRSCHGVDLRGGDMGGPNLLRSDVMLNDQNGELLTPILNGSRASRGMDAISLPEAEVTALAAYIRSILAKGRPQGAPPAGAVVELNILVGDASAGQAAFAAKCASCHSPTGDLAGIGKRYADATRLQNLWVGGGSSGPNSSEESRKRRDVTVVVTDGSGQKTSGRLERIDDFNVTLIFDDGSRRTFRRVGDVPKVEINDPLAAHKALLLTYTDPEIHNITAYLVTLK